MSEQKREWFINAVRDKLDERYFMRNTRLAKLINADEQLRWYLKQLIGKDFITSRKLSRLMATFAEHRIITGDSRVFYVCRCSFGGESGWSYRWDDADGKGNRDREPEDSENIAPQ